VSPQVVLAEVDAAIASFDENGNGTLEIAEYVTPNPTAL